MARVAGVELPKEKRIDIALSYIYGVGRPLARRLVDRSAINPATRVKNLTEAEVSKLNALIAEEVKVEGDLRRELQQNIRRLIEIGAYRGMRHRRNLPCRGQRTRTNARTKRGKRRTVGSVRAAEKPTAPAKPSAGPKGVGGGLKE
ncbi:MAG: 30S ribosomal protein S13 [Elusimicrobia bacterium]|nr:30S ribosomal protein S13 [Elusimicrobiota bacterium]